MNKSHVLIALTLFLVPGIVGNASAARMKYIGNGWVANHEGTNEYYLVINKDDIDLTKKIKVKGLKTKSTQTERQFDLLTGKAGNNGVTWVELDPGKGKLKRLIKKGNRKSRKLVKKGKLDAGDQMAWIDNYVHEKMAAKLFKVKFKDLDGNKWMAKFGFDTFPNPIDGIGPEGNNDGIPKSVPEPATLILLGCSLLGLGALRRLNKRQKSR